MKAEVGDNDQAKSKRGIEAAQVLILLLIITI
ncbi:Hypothetical protein PAU_03523 [Photorhabdus asymbiotica]|uniref:Uncharacterized protein n=1 Tax=Photorhabdus asymbiotica subsp. asymbiotica (strain ATCC 43949 / 3105-77) TaxID=553480 RepID=C7BKB4_PHOAA|nr:Hypothetical protein PAU_03523 [Photorhabdus asymbiotica]